MSFVTQGSLPEVVERSIGESVSQRTAILDNIQDLGPPDMVHLTKGLHNSSSRSSDIGTYFYYTGSDVSNPATIAALLSSIANIIGETPQLWFGKHKAFNVSEATYCSFNSFSKQDVRVSVHFPGGVKYEFINLQGEKVGNDINDENLWIEVYMSAIVRSLISADGDSNDFSSLVEVRKINPFLSESNLDLFFKGFEKLFYKGVSLGCNEDTQIPTNTNNYLIDTFIKTIQLTGQFEKGIEILERIQLNDSSVTYLIAKLYLLDNQELKAINILHEGISRNPLDGQLLILQSEFCLSKNRTDLSLPLAVRAVNCLPSSFQSWSLLARNYIAVGDYENALLTLNSCPMTPNKEKYHLKRVLPSNANNLHLPLPVDVVLNNVTNLNSMDISIEHDKIDQTLFNLPAGNLKSTFAKAYSILTQIVYKTGWENLLKYRTKVFVMEEEFHSSRGSSNKSSRENVAAPKTAVISDETHASTEENGRVQVNGEEKQKGKPVDDFRKKRLCERWLDNLFMILYEDLRVFTMFRSELLHFDSLQMEMNKSTLEWELLGMVSNRLGHSKEAADTFRRGLKNRFSVKSSKKLLEFCLAERERLIKIDNQPKKVNSSTDNLTTTNGSKSSGMTLLQYNDEIIDLVIKLTVWNHRWYCEFSPFLINAIRVVIEEMGTLKFESMVKGLYDNDKSKGVFELINNSLMFLQTYKLIDSEDV